MEFTIILAILVVLFFSLIWRTLEVAVWRPKRFAKSFEEQGMRGEPYKLLRGSYMEIMNLNGAAKEMILDPGCHYITPRVLPHFHKWSSQYGKNFYFWLGTQPTLCIRDPEIARKMMMGSESRAFIKLEANPAVVSAVGKGMVFLEGEAWEKRRRVVSPAFTLDRLKMMATKMSDCTLAMFDGWKDRVTSYDDSTSENEIEMAEQFRELTANIISHTAFGSCYKEGKKAFAAQRELMEMAVASIYSFQIPGMQYFPTKRNLHKWKLKRTLRSLMTRIVKRRLDNENSDYGNDLLGVLLQACKVGSSKQKFELNMEQIIQECQAFFFGGHETTSQLLTWTTFLLCIYPDWQERLRNEVLEECGTQIPTVDIVGKLRLVNMVLLEALRLYPPVVLSATYATKDINLGDLKLLKGTAAMIPILMIHTDKEYWGEDADQFNPMRFENGVVKAAKHPSAMMAFSLGPRTCVGQNFAMLEAKIALAMMLQRFAFSISPRYKHTPTSHLTLYPQHGVPVIVRSLNAE